MPVLFVLFQSAGILWADSGGAIAWPLVAAMLIIAAAGAWGLYQHQQAPLARTSARPASNVRAFSVVLPPAFLLGFFAHADRISEATLDATRLRNLDPSAFYLVDAFVESRQAGPFGDEVLLGSLRSVATGDELLRRAELRLNQASRDFGRERPAESVPASRAEQLLWPGASVRIGVRLSRADSTRNPGSPDWERARARRGRVARARLVDSNWVVEHVGAQGALGRLRSGLERRRRLWQRDRADSLAGLSSGQALARALVLGDRSGLDEAARSAFRKTGLGHLLAVSGLHVGFVAGFAIWLSRRATARLPGARLRRLRGSPFAPAVWAGVAFAAIYAWMTGAAISVVRAGLLLGLFVGVRQGGRNLGPLSALAWVGACLLWVNPAALFDLGARFSFTACGALVASGLWRDASASVAEENSRARQAVSAGAGLKRKLRASLAASLAVSFGTLPWVAQLQGPLHGFSPFFNLVAIPWTGLIVLPTAMAGVCATEVLPASWIAGLLWPAAVLTEAVEWIAQNGSARSIPSPFGIAFGVAVSCALGGVWLVRCGALSIALVLWGTVVTLGVLPPSEGTFEIARPRAVFFDVGQGDAALLQSTSSTWLVDTGPGPQDGSGGRALVRGLNVLGVREIDILVVTHADLDHRGGAKRVLETLPVGVLWLPETGRQEPSLRVLERVAASRGTRVRRVRAEDQPAFVDPELAVEVLWPAAEGRGPTTGWAGNSRNESSLVLRFTFGAGGQSLLMAADIGHKTERALLAAPERLRSDLLKVGHHGSRGSTGAEFLEAVAPGWVIVSAPCEPTRGLPSRTVLERLVASGAQLAWTGRDGALGFELGAARAGRDSIWMRRWASQRSCMGVGASPIAPLEGAPNVR